MKQMHIYMLNNIILMMLILISVLISVAFFTLFERKMLSYIHYRKGPNKVGFWGMLQPFSDAIKLLSKEFFFPLKSNYYYYFMSPMFMFLLTMTIWLIYPIKTNLLNWNLNSLFFICLMSLGVYGLMISGWSSNSSFSMIGAIRSVAQSISYEVTFSMAFLISLMMINSLNLMNITTHQKYIWMIFMMWPSSLILMISMLAEINRTPFDLSEGESELVSGFNIEYSSNNFVLIFLSEYASIMFMMFLFNYMYMCSNMYNMLFYIMVLIFLFFSIWIRTTLPRIRYDILMYFCWMYLLPMIIMIFMFYTILIKYSLEYILEN